MNSPAADATPKSGSSPTRAATIPSSVLEDYPEAYGAAGDGVTDDTAAINRYIAAVKSKWPAASTTYLVYCFKPHSVYLISNSLNFGYTYTGGDNPTFMIEGNGAQITGSTPGGPMLDCINFGYGSGIHNLVISGAAGGAQTCAVLYGYSQLSDTYGGGWSDQFLMSNVKIIGNFQYGCVLNRGSDTCSTTDCAFTNSISTGIGIQAGSSGSALIMDNAGQWPVTSQIAPLKSLGKGNDTNNAFKNCTFASYLGSPIWFSWSGAHSFFKCYAVTSGEVPICVVYIVQGDSFAMRLHFDVHCENLACTQVFYFDAPWATSSVPCTLNIDWFHYEDRNSLASTSIFAASQYIVSINFLYLDLAVNLQTSAVRIFDTPAKYSGNGRIISTMAPSSWNAPAFFNGDFIGVNGAAFTFGAGSVRFLDASAPGAAYYGTTPVALTTSMTNGLAAAAGTNFATATQLSKEFSIVTSGTPGGVILPPMMGIIYKVWNYSGSPLTVYTPAGAMLGTMPVNTTTQWFAFNATTYDVVP